MATGVSAVSDNKTSKRCGFVKPDSPVQVGRAHLDHIRKRYVSPSVRIFFVLGRDRWREGRCHTGVSCSGTPAVPTSGWGNRNISRCGYRSPQSHHKTSPAWFQRCPATTQFELYRLNLTPVDIGMYRSALFRNHYWSDTWDLSLVTFVPCHRRE